MKKSESVSTQSKYAGYADYLIGFYGADRRIDTITPADAAMHKTWLATERIPVLVESTITRAIRAFRTFFTFAVDLCFIDCNPYKTLKVEKERDETRVDYVSIEEVEQLIKFCKHPELKFIVALARLTGVRVPHEIMNLRFSDFHLDRAASVFVIPHKTKTGMREIPFFSELRPYFDLVKLQAKPEQEYVFEHYRRNGKNIGTLIRKARAKAGLRYWEKVFVNLRASRIIELEEAQYPESTLDAIFGNTAEVRRRHYLKPRLLKQYSKVLADSRITSVTLPQ